MGNDKLGFNDEEEKEFFNSPPASFDISSLFTDPPLNKFN